MKTFRFLILTLLCAVAQGAWAQTYITDVMLVSGTSSSEIEEKFESYNT